MKKTLKTSIVWLLVFAALLLVSCDEDKTSPVETSSAVTTVEAAVPVDPSEFQEPKFVFSFAPNEEDPTTCSIVDLEIQASPNQPLHVEFPAASPEGLTVTKIQNMGFIGNGNIPRIMTKETYDRIMKAYAEKNQFDENNFYYKRLTTFFSLKDLSQCKTSAAEEAMLKSYPVTAIMPIYVLTMDISFGECQLLSDALDSADYTAEQCRADYGALVQAVKASPLCTDLILDSIKDGYYPSAANVTSVSIPETVQTLGDGAFAFWNGLESISIPSGVTGVGADAFYGCEQLKQEENGVFYVGQWAVELNKNDQNMTLRNGALGIADALFYRSYILKSIELPNSMKYIGKQAFEACADLSSITFQGSKSEWEAVKKGDEWEPKGSYTVHCNDGDIVVEK